MSKEEQLKMKKKELKTEKRRLVEKEVEMGKLSANLAIANASKEEAESEKKR